MELWWAVLGSWHFKGESSVDSDYFKSILQSGFLFHSIKIMFLLLFNILISSWQLTPAFILGHIMGLCDLGKVRQSDV